MNLGLVSLISIINSLTSGRTLSLLAKNKTRTYTRYTPTKQSERERNSIDSDRELKSGLNITPGRWRCAVPRASASDSDTQGLEWAQKSARSHNVFLNVFNYRFYRKSNIQLSVEHSIPPPLQVG